MDFVVKKHTVPIIYLTSSIITSSLRSLAHVDNVTWSRSFPARDARSSFSCLQSRRRPGLILNPNNITTLPITSYWWTWVKACTVLASYLGFSCLASSQIGHHHHFHSLHQTPFFRLFFFDEGFHSINRLFAFLSNNFHPYC